MPQKNKKTKKKGNGRRNETEKIDKNKSANKGLTLKTTQDLYAHFTAEELRDLRATLKTKDLVINI